MPRWWREILIGVLCLLLFTLTINYVVARSQYSMLQGQSVKTEQFLVKSTQLVVELRKKAILRDFDSLGELFRWVNNWEVENKPIVISILNKTFMIAGNDELYSRYWDCDDISEAMQRDALRDGYLMSMVLVDDNGVVYGRKVSNLESHAGNMVVVENAFYYIEPQTGEIVFIVERD